MHKYAVREAWPDEEGTYVSIQDYLSLQDQRDSAISRIAQLEDLMIMAERRFSEELDSVKSALASEILELNLKLNRVVEAASALNREINR